MMHEDRLFQNFKAGLENYSPEVPDAVYSGMRRKLWMSQFLKFNLTSLNVWYVGTAMLVGAAIWSNSADTGAKAQLAASNKVDLLVSAMPCQAANNMASCTPETALHCAKYVASNKKSTPLSRVLVPNVPVRNAEDGLVMNDPKLAEQQGNPVDMVTNTADLSLGNEQAPLVLEEKKEDPAKTEKRKKKTYFIETYQK